MNQVKIGRFIAETRKQNDLTQREFADALMVSDKTVSKWECGRGMPELSLIEPICKAHMLAYGGRMWLTDRVF